MLNLSRNIRNSRFAQAFTVERSSGKWITGEFTETKEIKEKVSGVITAMNTKELEMLPEGDRIKGGINIYTLEPLYATRLDQNNRKTGLFADEVIYKGEHWKVISDSNRSEHGFYKAMAVRKLGA